MQITAKDILRRKGSAIISVRPDQSIFELVKIYIEYNIGAVLVMSGERLVGIVSERDVARNVVLQGKDEHGTQVSEIMSKDVISVGPDMTVEACMALMTSKRVRHLPVLHANQLVGVLSIGDLVNSLISQKQFVIEQLEGYITGRI